MYLNDAQLDSGALARRLLAPVNNLVPVNLLSRQQASFEDAGTGDWVVSGNCTIARSTAQAYSGSGSLEVTSTAAATASVRLASGTSAYRVLPNRPYTAIGYARAAVTARAASVYITWYDAAGSSISSSTIADVATTTSSWTRLQSTAVSPATAAYATVFARFSGAAAAGEVHYFDGIGFWEGAGGSWVNGGERLDPSTLGWYWDESVGRRLFVWDTINSRWQMVYGDTGWRNVGSLWTLDPGHTSITAMIRRINYTITVQISANTTTASSVQSTQTLGTGWQNQTGTAINGMFATGGTLMGVVSVGATGVLTARTSASVSGLNGSLVYSTPDAWPTSLPGTASGTIPNL